MTTQNRTQNISCKLLFETRNIFSYNFSHEFPKLRLQSTKATRILDSMNEDQTMYQNEIDSDSREID